MKKILLFAMIIMLGAGLRGFAQPGNKVEALKIAFLTRKLNLSPQEAQKFWPIYNKYTGEIRKTRQQNKNDDEVVLEEKIVAIRKKYKPEFGTALSADKVNLFFKADKEFNSTVQREVMERKEKKGKGGGKKQWRDDEE